MELTPQMWIVVIAVVLIGGGAVWQWGKPLWQRATKEAEKTAPTRHDAVNAYELLCDFVDPATQQTLHTEVWPALGRIPESKPPEEGRPEA
jgi:hypothetical protein